MNGRLRARFLQRAARANLTLPDAAVDQIEAYYVLLNHWNRKINLTALPLEAMSDQAIDRMLVEPLVAANDVPDSPLRWFDLGSGGGSPALPIKIARPLAELTLIEARSRKAAFLREAVRELSLLNVAVVDDRFEKLAARSEVAGTADLVTVRAVRTDAALFGSSRKLMKSGAELFLFAGRTAQIPPAHGFELLKSVPLSPAGDSELVVFKAS
jgi:16S rRNA (guanine527-N7)-methyltransferase